jgi:hypothetical protein
VYATDAFAWLALACVAACASPDERPAQWSYVHAAIIAPSCATSSCHSRVSSLAGLDLSTKTGAYVYLTGHVCGAPPHPQDPPAGTSPVYPGDPERSELIDLLRGTYEVDGEVLLMPPEQPLPAVEIEIIANWIRAGARCD